MLTALVRHLATSARPTLVALAGLVSLGPLAACNDAATPVSPVVVDSLPGTATVRWNAIARDLVVKHRPNNPAAFRLFAYLGQAQHAAAVTAESRDPRTVPGAVAAASAAVLAYVFPGEARALDSIVRVQERIASAQRDPSHPDIGSAFAAGEATGREVAHLVVARAQHDRFDTPFTGQIPSGPGLWVRAANVTPLMPALGQMRPFFLASGSQFRPAPPPAFGSPAFQVALAEVKQVALTRTPDQTRIAQAWALPGGTILPAGSWNVVAEQLALRHGLTERATARVFALMHAAMMDATIAVHDAKYTYWYIRPAQADTAIQTAIGTPAHPSYPSNHTAASVAAAVVLGAHFPADSARLEAMAAEAGISRLYGGIHYRFDIDAGDELGRNVARTVLTIGRLGADVASAR